MAGVFFVISESFSISEMDLRSFVTRALAAFFRAAVKVEARVIVVCSDWRQCLASREGRRSAPQTLPLCHFEAWRRIQQEMRMQSRLGNVHLRTSLCHLPVIQLSQ
jgi:hypothetical protein